MSSPLTEMVPAPYGTRKLMQRKRVVLPEPLGPITAIVSPIRTERFTSCSTRTPPRSTSTPFTSTTGRWSCAIFTDVVSSIGNVAEPLLDDGFEGAVCLHLLDGFIQPVQQLGIPLTHRRSNLDSAGQCCPAHTKLSW